MLNGDAAAANDTSAIEQANIQAIAECFAEGIKEPGQHGRLGVELEHIIVTEGKQPVAYSDEFGTHWILEQLSEAYPDCTYDEYGNLIGVAAGEKSITIEPAGQLELSAGPYENVGEVRFEFETFQRELGKLLETHRMQALAVGYHPTARAADLTIIDKQRYHFMDERFAGIGPYGRCMMRASASTQISIDYYSEADCLHKMRLASALAPIFALLCDNCAVFEGKPRTHQLVRTKIWLECDPTRCGTVPGIMNPDFTWEDYARYVLNVPAIFTVDANGEKVATDKTFGEVFSDTPMTHANVEQALSLLFNDVRLKQYIEIRPADSMPIPFVTAYAALIKGLFYSEESLAALDEMLAGVTEQDILDAKNVLMECGYDATVYGKPVGELIDRLFELAHAALEKNEQSYFSPLEYLSKARKTLATLAE